jgi:thioredoxin-like negative regulator of GroEL
MTPERWQQIDRLLEQALEEKPEKRSAFLDKACAGDEVLRREAESLLAAHDQASHFMQNPALNVASQVSEQKESQSLVHRTESNLY